MLYYGLALGQIKYNNSNLNEIRDLLSNINPNYNGERSKEIKNLVNKYFTDNEWKEEYHNTFVEKKNFKESMELVKKMKEEQANKPLPTIGMTKEEVIESKWGKPKKINKTTNVYGVSEQWVYPNFKYLYFDDGILATIQE